MVRMPCWMEEDERCVVLAAMVDGLLTHIGNVRKLKSHGSDVRPAAVRVVAELAAVSEQQEAAWKEEGEQAQKVKKQRRKQKFKDHDGEVLQEVGGEVAEADGEAGACAKHADSDSSSSSSDEDAAADIMKKDQAGKSTHRRKKQRLKKKALEGGGLAPSDPNELELDD